MWEGEIVLAHFIVLTHKILLVWDWHLKKLDVRFNIE